MGKFVLPFVEQGEVVTKYSPAAMFLFAVVTGGIISLQTDPVVVVILIGLIVLGGTIARTRWRVVLSLALRFEIIILFWILLEPFLYGTTIILVISTPFGQLNVYSEGVMMGILLGARMMALLLLFLTILSHMTLSDFIAGLRTLHVPGVILGSLLIMLRYIPLFLEEKTRMQEAQLLRGFQHGSRWERITSLGYLVGSTVDRAFDRSLTVYEAMSLRGFGSEMAIQGSGFKQKDFHLLLMIIGTIITVYLLLPHQMDVIVWIMRYL